MITKRSHLDIYATIALLVCCIVVLAWGFVE